MTGFFDTSKERKLFISTYSSNNNFFVYLINYVQFSLKTTST